MKEENAIIISSNIGRTACVSWNVRSAETNVPTLATNDAAMDL